MFQSVALLLKMGHCLNRLFKVMFLTCCRCRSYEIEALAFLIFCLNFKLADLFKAAGGAIE